MFTTFTDAGWSSLVARRAHNPKVVGSNPAPATKYQRSIIADRPFLLPVNPSLGPFAQTAVALHTQH
ncbi:hypothetical protein GP2143_11944 [marine gamma proteobacterium HTCC2143]|uniref:Uncharacterized protein n=1 Tax=marine gamma proteobacterium HTCC2143 TaxID=247633 RepID=A0YH35_9GAMM|nr:hypothetical protein GP2143_11944 [marine gamma proteobacterium HTCC2143]